MTLLPKRQGAQGELASFGKAKRRNIYADVECRRCGAREGERCNPCFATSWGFCYQRRDDSERRAKEVEWGRGVRDTTTLTLTSPTFHSYGAKRATDIQKKAKIRKKTT